MTRPTFAADSLSALRLNANTPPTAVGPWGAWGVDLIAGRWPDADDVADRHRGDDGSQSDGPPKFL